MKYSRTINRATKELFVTFIVVYILLNITEGVRKGFVSNVFNMNYLLLVILISGLGLALTQESRLQNLVKFRKRTAQAVINLAVKSAYQAKSARLAAQQRVQAMQRHTAIPKAKAWHTPRTGSIAGMVAAKPKKIFRKPLPGPELYQVGHGSSISRRTSRLVQ